MAVTMMADGGAAGLGPSQDGPVQAGPAPDGPAPDGPGQGRILAALVVGLCLDAGLSVLAYGVARLVGWTPFAALLAGAVVAGLRALWVVVRRRQVDPFALFMVGVFAVGLATSLLTGSARFLLVKESFGTGAAGLAFVLTCLRGRPLAYHAAARVAATTPEERAEWDDLWETEPTFRRRFVTMSLVIGGALLVEALARIPLVYALPVDVMALLSPVLSPLVIILTSVWAVRYGTRTPEVIESEHAAREGR